MPELTRTITSKLSSKTLVLSIYFSSATSSEMDMAEANLEASSKDTQFPMCDTTAHSTYPSFVKTIRSSIMRNDQMELPAAFVKEHGHNFQATVILQGPSGGMKSVRLRIQSHGQDRVHFRGAAWRAFVLENGFKVGHELLFSLISTSTFTVRLVENSTASSTGELQQHSQSLEEQEEEQRHGSKTVTTSNNNCRLPSYLSEMKRNRPSGNSKNDVIYATNLLSFKRELETRVESLLKNLQCPHFVTIMGKSHLRDYRSSALGVPVKFMKKYGTYFSEVQFFQGPSGRTVEVRFAPGGKDARFSTGWKAFHKENGFNLGDVLLFSLSAPGCWLVQVVDRRGEELVLGELCDPSDIA